MRMLGLFCLGFSVTFTLGHAVAHKTAGVVIGCAVFVAGVVLVCAATITERQR